VETIERTETVNKYQFTYARGIKPEPNMQRYPRRTRYFLFEYDLSLNDEGLWVVTWTETVL